MTELRTRPGEVLDRVADTGQAFVIERNGRRMACLVPLSLFVPDVSPARIAVEMKELEDHHEETRPTVTEARELAFRFPIKLNNNTPVDVSIVLPHGYPHACPRVYAASIREDAPHRWADGALCLYGFLSGWNPGKHTVFSTLELARGWLRHYDEWLDTGDWPREQGSSNE